MNLESYQRNAISRGATVGVIIIILVVAAAATYFLVSAPGTTTTSPSTTTTTTTPPTQTYKSTMVLGTTDTVETSIDPNDAYDYFGDSMINQLGAPLVDFAPGVTDTAQSNLQPALATKWTVSSDGLTYTFLLRAGLKYDDGTPFNSTSVVYSINREIALANPEGGPVGVGVSDGSGGSSIISSVTAPNSTAVVFKLKTTTSFFLSMLTFAALYPVNPTKAPMPTVPHPGTLTGTVNYTAGNPAASNPNGLGPYTLTEWTRSGNKDVEMTLKANHNYWNYPAYPKTPTIIIKFYPDSTSLTAAIKSGDVDIAYRQFSTSDLSSLSSTSGLKVYPSPGAFIQYLVINQKIAPFNNSDVRQGLAAAMNRTDLINTVFAGTATALYSQIPVGMAYHQDAFKTAYGAGANYNLTRADLAKAGYTATNKLGLDLYYETTGHYPQSADQAQVLKKDFEASGVISVTLKGVDFPTLRAYRNAGSMPMFIYGWYPDFIDPYDYTTPFFQSAASTWLNDGYNSSAMDRLLAESVTSPTSQLTSVYSQIQALQATDVPTIPIYQGGANCCGAVASTHVLGVYLDVTLIFRLATLQETTS